MRRYSTPLTLPFPGLGRPHGLAIDARGGLLVTDYEPDPDAPPGLGVTKWGRLSRVPAEGGAPTTIMDTLGMPDGVAAGAAGEIYVADNNSSSLVVSANATVSLWPSVGPDRKPCGVAVGPDGAVYAVYHPGFTRGEGRGGVLRLADKKSVFGKAKHVRLPIDVRFPGGMAVDAAGVVYVVDGRVVKRWAPGEPGATTLPFTGLNFPSAVAVDSVGAVYVSDMGDDPKVVVLEQATGEQHRLPVEGLGAPRGIAIDAAGDVIIADSAQRRIVVVPPG
ncbi:hypothetical protein [Gordonia crocea]|uniref:Gluconolaconase n=1 Tax=Gordonia crocea TaxID=589162 RepID=A0A7I9UXC4_9ACTN|nr:hypothetical protein [Gordonia crocea]GED97582.1 hypothetical protein nbrc107697_16210 [Gordonia crocea]